MEVEEGRTSMVGILGGDERGVGSGVFWEDQELQGGLEMRVNGGRCRGSGKRRVSRPGRWW